MSATKHAMITGFAAVLLAGCGGGSSPQRVAYPGVMPMATGPINSACLASDRSAKSRRICGCIQAVADETLSGSQQRRAAAFYGDPHRAQEIRQSDRTSDERFWKTYRAYADRAERICR